MKRIAKTLVLIALVLPAVFSAGCARQATEWTMLHVTMTPKHVGGQTWRARVKVKNVGPRTAVNPIRVKLWVAGGVGDLAVPKLYIRDRPLRPRETVTRVFYFKARRSHKVFATAWAKNSAGVTSEQIAVPVNPITWVVMALAMVLLARRRRKPAHRRPAPPLIGV